MTRSGAWSRSRKTRPRQQPPTGPMAAGARRRDDQNLAIGQPSLIISAERPPEPSSPLPDEPPTVSPPRAEPACFMCQTPVRTTMQATELPWRAHDDVRRTAHTINHPGLAVGRR
jgi:hypothetical protein